MDRVLTSDEELRALLEYNPPSIQVPPVPDKEHHSPALSFYDKHLSSNLALVRVVHLPTLLEDMTEAIDSCLDIANAEEISLPSVTFRDSFCSKRMRDSTKYDRESTDVLSIAKLYGKTTANNCRAVASTLSLTPGCSMWLPVISFAPADVVDDPTDQGFTLEEYSLCLLEDDNDLYLFPEIKDALTDDKLQLLRCLLKRDCRLATWEFLPYTTQAITIMRNLCGGKLARSKTSTPFKMRTYPPIVKPHSPVVPLPNDAEIIPGRPRALRRSLRSRKTVTSVDPPKFHPATVRIGLQPPVDRSPTVEHVLQHAWVTACRRDSTFIIFQCGNYERIGIRHRASNTLYLSDMIDVPNMSEPCSYSELHINLYISILDDAMQRAAHFNQHEGSPAQPQKRPIPANDPSLRSRKRRKLRSHNTRLSNVAPADISPIRDSCSDVCRRHTLLLCIQYGVYSSPNPAPFFRCGHQPNFAGAKQVSYKATEYLHLKLTSLITRGATGTVHEGTLEAYRKDEESMTYQVVAKLAFGDAQRARMKHEASIYDYLTKEGVRGIPKCYGIFEDLHGGPLVLVTSHEGFWLRHWVPDDSGITIPTLWGKKFLLAMKEIHHAGVCHRDIRPENLLVNEDGAVCIIDFDKADLTSSVGARKREYKHLEYLLAGMYIPPGSYPSPRTASSGSGLSPSPVSESD